MEKQRWEEAICSGYLTKSPPEYKINRARWQRRWFVLKRGPNAVYLQYYKDHHSSRPKGTIDLNSCEQVDQGLSFESRRSLANSYIFDIVTPKRKYFLVSNTELDMIRWVRAICLACGFHLESQDEDQAVDPAPPTQPISVAQSPRNECTPKPYPASAPAVPSEMAEPYIPLNECVTVDTQDLSQSVPINGGWNSTQNQEEMFIMDQNTSRSRTGSSNSNSSIPQESAPLPPERNSARNSASASMDLYDIPPALQRPGSDSMQPMYDIPPALLKQEDDIYKPVPVPRLADQNSSVPSSFMYDECNNVNDNLYAVPPSHAGDAGGLYDCPPARPLSLIQNQDKEMSLSTDRLAQDFQQISVRNSMGASDDGSMDLYSVPPAGVRMATDLFSSPDDGSLKSATPPPRPPKLDPASATNIENQSMPTPPRPPKPQHLRPSTPPPSFDETYDVPPGHSWAVSSQELIGRLSEIPIYAVPPTNDIRSPPNGHQWLDSKVPTPGGKDRYINTRQSPGQQPTPVPPKSVNFINSRAIPPPQPQRSSIFDSDARYAPNPVGQKESYLPMQGSNESSNVFQYPDSSTYMAMEGTNSGGGVRPEGRLPSDAQQETYAVMNSAVPVQWRPLPSNAHRHTFSGGPRPPPINRSLKPDRKSSEGTIRSTDHIGMAGSYYAVKNDHPPRPLNDLWPIQSDRTRSFSRNPGQYENKRLDPDLDPFRGRSNTGDSTTSSSDDDMYGAGAGDSEIHFSRQVLPVPEEDTYVFNDVPGMGMLFERPITEGLSSTPIPAPPPSQQNDDIEYLELFHDNTDEVPRQPPPRPPKPSSPTVEYIDLDLGRTQALKSVKEKREEEMDGGVGGRDTLTRRE